MNTEDIIRMAREAGAEFAELPMMDAWLFAKDEYLKRFAALVIANHPPQSYMTWQEGYSQGRLDESLEAEREEREAVEAEREACAKVCEDQADDGTEGEWDGCCLTLAKQIRARGRE